MAPQPPVFPPPPSIPTTDLLSFLFAPVPDKVDNSRPLFVSAEDNSISYTRGQALTLIRRLIAGLRSLPAIGDARLDQRPVVLIHSYNSALYPILILAIVGAGAIFVGSNPAYTPYELSHAIRATGAGVVLSEREPEMLARMQAALRENSVAESNLFTLDSNVQHDVPNGSNLRSWTSLLDHGSSDWIHFDSKELSQTTTACFFFSSGTTGLPKPVRISHYNLIAQQVLVYQPYQHLRQPHMSGYERGVKTVIPIPIFHIGVGPLTFVTSVKEGRTVYIMRRFELELFMELNAREKCNEVLIVPAIGSTIVASGLADEKDPRFKYTLRNIRYGLFGGSPLGRETQKRVQNLLSPGAVLGQLWGMTETTCIASFAPPGIDTPGMELKIVNESGMEVEDGKQGEMWVRGPTVTNGYHGAQAVKANQEVFTPDGWLRSGDLVYRDPQTKLFYVVGRLKELIKVRGFQVSPSEIEEALREVPGVGDVAVVGVPSAGSGEAPRAFVVRSADEKGRILREADLKKCVKERLASYKALEGGVRFLDLIPRNASGKILRRALVEMEEKEKGDGKGGLGKSRL